MRSCHGLLCLLFLAVFLPRVAGETKLSSEEVRAAYLTTFGREPTAGEWAETPATSFTSVKNLIAQLKQRLGGSAELQREVAAKAQRDAFGGELPGPSIEAKGQTYFERMTSHVQALATSATGYATIQSRAYRRAIGRDVYPEEQAYWKKFDPLPYALLVGSVDNWARRNQPGLMVTAGTPSLSVNSVFLLTVRLDPEQAAALRDALGWPAPVDGRHVIAPGSGFLASDGRMHFVAVGRD